MRSWSLTRRVAAVSLVALAVLAPAAFATNPGPPPLPISGAASPVKGVSATLSTDQPGARPVALTLAVQVPLVCGRPVGTTTVTLPTAADVPSSIAPGAVRVNTFPARKLSVSGSTVTIAGPALKGIMCHTVSEGIMRVVFTRAAGIGNPDRAGSYAVTVKHGLDAQRGTIVIR
jgi:hypothetical protein